MCSNVSGFKVCEYFVLIIGFSFSRIVKVFHYNVKHVFLTSKLREISPNTADCLIKRSFLFYLVKELICTSHPVVLVGHVFMHTER